MLLKKGMALILTYKTYVYAKKFTHYIAKSLQHSFLQSLVASNFYSFLMDASTDTGNVENELILVQYCTHDHTAQEIRYCARFLSLPVPRLSCCLGNALQILGINDILDSESVLGVRDYPVLIGDGTDRASVNIAEQIGMKGKLQKQLLWLHWVWCYAH